MASYHPHAPSDNALRCVVQRVTYANPQNGYTVIKCSAKGYDDLVTVVGTMPEVHVGAVLSLTGFWKVDAKYGRQFNALTYEETLPATVYGIEKYLGSGLIRGIGPKFAGRIVRTFREKTLDIIEYDPERLAEVPGIGATRVQQIKKSWADQKEIKNIMLFLQGHDVSTAHATKIYKTYGNDSIQIVQENPYRLADDIWGIGFRTADTIAKKMGFGHDRFERLRSGILYTLNQLADAGHCYATADQLIDAGTDLLEVEAQTLREALDRMLATQDVITEKDPETEELAIYLPPFFFAENGTARKLQKLMSGEPPAASAEKVERILSDLPIQYNEIQRQAIHTAAVSRVMVLTGGPGTGKTTTTRGILSVLRGLGRKVLLAAPTGRAAKRLAESTGMEAKTIHRLLEFKPPEGYQRTEENPLEGDVLIVDECSMIDVLLMYSLLKAMPENMGLILVGDTDQLPSVGAGNVFRDIIESGTVPVLRLTEIFRQAMGSRIVMNAHRINRGEKLDLYHGQDSDFFFAKVPTLPQDPTSDEPPAADQQAAVDMITNLIRRRLPQFYGVDAQRDIQVLTPMQRGLVGAANLNQVLQAALNPDGPSLRRGGMEYRLRDKVMQIKNDYDKEVFNGDIGTIEQVHTEDQELTVNYDGRSVTYDVSELDELVLAYATTIHKAQGSEYPIVILPVMMTHFVMLQRNLLYTGVTRAKKALVLVGEMKAIWYCIRNSKISQRNTRLADRLKGRYARRKAAP